MWIYKYWINTRTPLYSFLFTVPLFFIYEIGIFLTSYSDMVSMRNGADALMTNPFCIWHEWLLLDGSYILFRFILVLYIKAILAWYGSKQWFLPLMLAESMAAMGLYFLCLTYILLMNPNGSILTAGHISGRSWYLWRNIISSFINCRIGSILGFIFQWSDMLKNWVAMIIAQAYSLHSILLANMEIIFHSIFSWLGFLRAYYWVFYILCVVLVLQHGPMQFMTW